MVFIMGLALISCEPNVEDPIIQVLPEISQQGSMEDYQSMSIDFGLSMFQDVVDMGEENVLISPYSLQSALLMTMNGAEGETLNEFRDALNTQNFYPDGLREYYSILAEKLNPIGENTNFNSKNKLYYYPTLFSPDEEYVEEIESFYTGSFAEEDFSKEETVDVINDWVSETTEGRIEKVLDQINSDEALFLINALVFTADWALGFEPNASFIKSFTKGDGSIVEIPTMSSDDSRPFVIYEDFAAVDLPVKDEDYAVTFILPSENNDATNFAKSFNVDLYEQICNEMQLSRVQLYLPKFELATSMDMKEILEGRGMSTTFENADLSGMGDFAGNEYLTRVLHDVFIKIDERGIEGAAVTTVGVGVESVPPTLEFNRPFVFVVRHVETKVPIFIGKVGNPA